MRARRQGRRSALQPRPTRIDRDDAQPLARQPRRPLAHTTAHVEHDSVRGEAAHETIEQIALTRTAWEHGRSTLHTPCWLDRNIPRHRRGNIRIGGVVDEGSQEPFAALDPRDVAAVVEARRVGVAAVDHDVLVERRQRVVAHQPGDVEGAMPHAV